MGNVDFGNYKRIVQAFWDPEPKNDDAPASDIWCLGARYPSKRVKQADAQDAPPDQNNNGESDGFVTVDVNGTSAPDSKEVLRESTHENHDNSQEKDSTGSAWPSAFLEDYESRFWFTYRSSFPPIKKSPEASMTLSVRLRNLTDQSGFTSDTGWGCMIRSGQTLLANSLSRLRLGRDWRRGQNPDQERELLSLFADDPECPFSIHRFVEHGASACGKHPGEWFGPSATARCIQALSEDYPQSGLKVYVNGDGADVYQDRFYSLAKPTPDSPFTPTLILLQIRLGIERITPVYHASLKRMLQLPQSVGIAGGRTASSHYFFATQGDSFFYLDPHFTRPALPRHAKPAEYTVEEIESCHTRRVRRIGISGMDPSMLIAFLISSEDEWREWRRSLASEGKGESKASGPAGGGKTIVHVADREPGLHGLGGGVQRSDAVDDVEAFDEEEDGVGDRGGKAATTTTEESPRHDESKVDTTAAAGADSEYVNLESG